MTSSDELDATFAALAHPVRREILARLAEKDATVNELAEPFDMSLPAVSKHLRVLEAAGLISRGRNAQFRPCRINTAPIEALANWTHQYRHIWEARFGKMAGIIEEMKGEGRD